LKRLRKWKNQWHYWVDAICINQASIAEENHQLPLMGKIYSQARGVAIWLGEERDDSKLAMALIQRWGDGINAAMKLGEDQWVLKPLEAFLKFIEDPYDEKSIKALNLLLRRDYWRRLWIIQEIVLAKTRVLFCGEDVVEYNLLCRAYTVWRDI
jgi:hypothetical protein